MKGKIRTRLAAVLFGLILFSSLAEIGSRIVFFRVMNFNVEMWKYARMVKVSGVTEGIRFEHRPGVKADLMGVPVAINSDGMRGPEVSQEPTKGTFRIAVLGDSITLGWGVREEETFARRLEGMLSGRMEDRGAGKMEVLNFGVGNYNIEDDYMILREKVLKFKPHAVILALFINDAEPVRPVRNNFILKNSCFAVWVWGQMDSIYRSFGLRADYESYYKGLYSVRLGGLERMRTGISKIADLCRQEEIIPIALILPELHRLDDYPFVGIHEDLGSLVSSNSIPVLDLYPSVQGLEPETLWVSDDDPHPNGKAHGIYAHAILSGIDWEDVLEERLAQ